MAWNRGNWRGDSGNIERICVQSRVEEKCAKRIALIIFLASSFFCGAKTPSTHAAPREHRDRQEQEMVKREYESTSSIHVALEHDGHCKKRSMSASRLNRLRRTTNWRIISSCVAPYSRIRRHILFTHPSRHIIRGNSCPPLKLFQPQAANLHQQTQNHRMDPLTLSPVRCDQKSRFFPSSPCLSLW